MDRHVVRNKAADVIGGLPRPAVASPVAVPTAIIRPVPDEPTPSSSSSDAPDPQPPKVEPFSHAPVAARVPPRIGAGAFCTNQVILDGPKELVIDFLQGLTRPFQVAQRVVLAPATAAELAEALRQNLEMYAAKFGQPPTPPPPQQPQRQLTLAEVYENFRIADDMLAGAYANSVLVGHSATEFFMDFIAGFYPTSAVSARVFMSAPMIPKFVATLTTILDQHAKRFGGGGMPPPPPSIAG